MQLEAQFLALGRISLYLVHDVQKPLSAFFDLYKNIDIHALPQKLKIEFQDTYRMIRSSEVYLKNLFQDMLDVNSIKKVEFEFVSINCLIIETLQMISFHQGIRHLQFVYDFHHKFCIFGSKIQLQRAFYNLISNAIDAMKGHGLIWFQTYEKNDQLFLILGNSNAALPTSIIKKIFQPFVTANKENGNGLGLFIVKKVMDSHHCFIHCNNIKNKFIGNQSIEFGVEFTLIFQLSHVTTEDRHNAEEGPLFFKSEHETKLLKNEFEKKVILLIDDDFLIHKKWKRLQPDYDFLSFYSLDECYLGLIEIPWEKTQFVICDYFFSTQQEKTVSLLFYEIRKYFRGKIFLASYTQKNFIQFEETLDVTVMPEKFFQFT